MKTQRILLRIAVVLALSAAMVFEAQAIVGRPLSPLSVGGVARRTAVRTTAVVTTTATASASAAASQQQAAAAQQQAAAAQQQQAVAAQQAAAAQAMALPPGTTVSALPSGCSSVNISGTDYFNCAGTYYRAAFKSNNIVFIVSKP